MLQSLQAGVNRVNVPLQTSGCVAPPASIVPGCGFQKRTSYCTISLPYLPVWQLGDGCKDPCLSHSLTFSQSPQANFGAALSASKPNQFSPTSRTLALCRSFQPKGEIHVEHQHGIRPFAILGVVFSGFTRLIGFIQCAKHLVPDVTPLFGQRSCLPSNSIEPKVKLLPPCAIALTSPCCRQTRSALILSSSVASRCHEVPCRIRGAHSTDAATPARIDL